MLIVLMMRCKKIFHSKNHASAQTTHPHTPFAQSRSCRSNWREMMSHQWICGQFKLKIMCKSNSLMSFFVIRTLNIVFTSKVFVCACVGSTRPQTNHLKDNDNMYNRKYYVKCWIQSVVWHSHKCKSPDNQWPTTNHSHSKSGWWGFDIV